MFRFLLNLLFPQNELVSELEEMTVETFLAAAAKSETRAGREIVSLFDYRHALTRRAVWELKYRGNQRVAALLGRILHDELLAFLEEYGPLANFTEPLLIPVPLSRERRRERGFNQCELLIDAVMRCDMAKNFSFQKSVLIKVRETPSQTKTESRSERHENLKGCFCVAEPALVGGRNVVLIDDVATTGATLEEARKALRAAGARRVVAFTIAH